mgnify:CR=1 FL=1
MTEDEYKERVAQLEQQVCALRQELAERMDNEIPIKQAITPAQKEGES